MKMHTHRYDLCTYQWQFTHRLQQKKMEKNTILLLWDWPFTLQCFCAFPGNQSIE
jgi:hypothetical protein